MRFRMETDGHRILITAATAVIHFLAEDVEVIIHRITETDHACPAVGILTVADFRDHPFLLRGTLNAPALYLEVAMEMRKIEIRQIICTVT